jgi:SAM-dependent methyltransferase
MLSLEQQNRLRDRYREIRPGWQPATEVYSMLAKQYLRSDSFVLDLGCGRGGLIEQLEHPLAQVMGMDPDWLSLSQHRLAFEKPPMPRTVGLSRKMPFADNSFNLVLASWVLEHLDNPEADFLEISRVLAPEGVFIFITPNRQHPLIKLNLLLSAGSVSQRILVDRLYGRSSEDTFPVQYKANSSNDLYNLATASEMAIVDLRIIDDPSYLSLSPRLFNLACRIEKRLPAERRIHLVGIMKCISS